MCVFVFLISILIVVFHDYMLICYSMDDGDIRLIPAGDTEFAKDAAFGYKSSNLREVKHFSFMAVWNT